jgi:hypothetical protein
MGWRWGQRCSHVCGRHVGMTISLHRGSSCSRRQEAVCVCVVPPCTTSTMVCVCTILVGCPPGSRPPQQSSVFSAYSWKGGAIVAHVEHSGSLPSQHQLEMMLATPKSVGLPLSQIWKGGERAASSCNLAASGHGG